MPSARRCSAGITFHPEQPAHLVADRNQHAAVMAGQDEELVDHRHDGGQGVLAPVFFQLFAVHGQRGLGVIRVGLQLGGPLPGFPDQAAQPGKLFGIREALRSAHGCPATHGRPVARRCTSTAILGSGCRRLDQVPHRTPTRRRLPATV